MFRNRMFFDAFNFWNKTSYFSHTLWSMQMFEMQYQNIWTSQLSVCKLGLSYMCFLHCYKQITSRSKSLLDWFISFRFAYWSYKNFIFLVFMNKYFALNTEVTQYHALTQQTHWIHRQFCVDMVVPTNWTCDWDWTASK